MVGPETNNINRTNVDALFVQSLGAKVNNNIFALLLLIELGRGGEGYR